jgi:hypothetical protein
MTPQGEYFTCLSFRKCFVLCFVDRCLSFCACCFGHFVVCSSSIYIFWLPFGIFKLLSKFKGQCLIEMTSGTIRLCHCIVCHPSIVFSVIPHYINREKSKIENCSGNGDRSSMIFFERPNLMILQVWSPWVNLLPLLLFHISMIISTCYLENGIKVKDNSRPWPLTHRLLSHKHGNILGTQICFLLNKAH